MISRILRLTAAAAVVSLFAAPVFAEDIVFTLHNATTTDVMEFYASPTSADDWEDDILGADILGAGESARVTIQGDRGCDYDLRAVFADETEVTDSLNLCETSDYTIVDE